MEEPIVMRIAPELRRSAYYVLASVVPLAIVAIAVAHYTGQLNVARAIGVSSPFLLLGLATIVPLRWSLRIDQRGVARRFLVRWDRWSWVDIGSGRIEKQHAYILVDPQRPWWRRRLTLEFLTPADIERAMERINAHYRLPDAPPLPDELTIKYGALHRRSMRLNAAGVHLTGANQSRAFLWNEVRRVHITRMDPVRRDFLSVEIALPDREIVLSRGPNETPWGGATAEAINAILTRYVPAERIDEDVHGQRLARREDIEKQLAEARRDYRGLRLGFLMCVMFLVVALAWMAFEESLLKAAAMTVFSAGFFAPLFWMMRRTLQSRCQELERQLSSFDEPGEGPAVERAPCDRFSHDSS